MIKAITDILELCIYAIILFILITLFRPDGLNDKFWAQVDKTMEIWNETNK